MTLSATIGRTLYVANVTLNGDLFDLAMDSFDARNPDYRIRSNVINYQNTNGGINEARFCMALYLGIPQEQIA